jgi:hypothetical protein
MAGGEKSAGRGESGKPAAARATAGLRESGLAALERENQSVNGDRFRERHADDGNNEDVAEGAGVAAHGLSSTEADEADADTGTRAGDAVKEPLVLLALASSTA